MLVKLNLIMENYLQDAMGDIVPHVTRGKWCVYLQSMRGN